MVSKWYVARLIYALAILVFSQGLVIEVRAETSNDPEQERVQAFSPAFVLGGTPRERGIAYGKHFRDGIRSFLDTQIYGAFADHPANKQEMIEFASACGKVVEENCPMVADEMKGIAEGSGIPFDEIVMIQLHEEFFHRGKLPKPGHCTAVAVAPSDSGDGHTYVGQTWDWFTAVAGHSALTEWQREDSASVLAYGFPGMPTGAGMNSRGIALCWTSCGLEKRGKESARVGLPSYTLINHLLAQKDMESVIREAKRDLHAGWFTFVMSDSEGNLVNIEGSPSGVTVERSSSRLARVSYGTREQTQTSPDDPIKLHPRCVKMNSLLQTSTGKNDLATLQDYFTKRKHGIMSWRNPRNKTIDMMVFDLTDRKAYLSRGPEFNLEWREFTFHPQK